MIVRGNNVRTLHLMFHIHETMFHLLIVHFSKAEQHTNFNKLNFQDVSELANPNAIYTYTYSQFFLKVPVHIITSNIHEFSRNKIANSSLGIRIT